MNFFIKLLGFMLALFPLALFAQDSNIAKGKVAKQSSNGQAELGVAAKAVDGNTSGIWANTNNSITHTSTEENPWWEVDLGSIYDISEIIIWNRTDCCSERLQSFYIMVGEAPIAANSTSLFLFKSGAQSFANGSNPSMSITGNKKGRYVRIFILGTDKVLSLAEVEVKGTLAAATPPVGVNVAKGKQAKQSSTSFGGNPERAIDGNTNGQWEKNSLTHTNEEGGSWWEVDLGAIYEIDSIVIWNRTDCCWERLQNFLVLTSKAPIVEVNYVTRGDGKLFGPFSPWSANQKSFTIEVGKNKTWKNARYLRLTLRQGSEKKPLSLAEVEVYGTPVVATLPMDVPIQRN